jgi:hypothetical protein
MQSLELTLLSIQVQGTGKKEQYCTKRQGLRQVVVSNYIVNYTFVGQT